ncbi:MAG: cupin domain-containing protein [Chitinophagales bacterium]|nr:AraC family ligand binding domain-containing protein [Saprospiraceae bacterium]MBP8754633.1 AraC family ligand binding domain-containing protein [Chitinophagales bacterium]MBP9127011.1 AraC family ligand binding domain-containing protein [Saprospiraceae bacterium]
MDKVTKPNVRTIASGKNLIAKQMQANAGDLLPKHVADLESILFIHEGECNLNINEEDIVLKKGEGYVIPPDTKHQITAITDFKGMHFMPVGIKFEFFN